MSQTWDGVFCALWTPTDAEGQLLESTLAANLEVLKRSRLQGLLALGSTGEFLHLDSAGRQRVMAQVAEWSGGLRLIANISDIRPTVVAELGRCARRLSAQAVSLLPPYFFPVAQADLVEFFVRGAEAAGLPLFLYNFPERTGNRIALESIAAVAERVPLAGVKQSGNEFSYHRELVALGREKGFVVLTGADTRLPEARAMGVSGCVSGLANAVPELVRDAWAGSQSESENAAAERLAELGQRIQTVRFPVDVAAAMEARGLGTGEFKSVLSESTRRAYRSLVSELRNLFRQWKLI
jgi:4-hydroxy-tetrahydrodipicolinate synthase